MCLGFRCIGSSLGFIARGPTGDRASSVVAAIADYAQLSY